MSDKWLKIQRDEIKERARLKREADMRAADAAARLRNKARGF